MDEKTRKYNDKHYDMWSTEGPGRLVGVSGNEKDIALSDWWHEYFFWKPVAKKQWHYNASELSRLYLKYFSGSLYDVFYRTSHGPRNRWGGEIRFLSTHSITEYPMSYTISILYKRDVASRHLWELSELQMECEELIEKTSDLYDVADSSRKLSRIILTFGRSIAKGEKAERKIKKMNTLIDKKMARVEELRQLILQEQQED